MDTNHASLPLASKAPENVHWLYVDPDDTRRPHWGTHPRELLDRAHDALRRISPQSTHVRRYTSDMASDLWERQSDGCILMFDPAGRLLSGRKRLTAMINANYAMWMLCFTVSESPHARFVIDSGKARSAGDALATYGIPNANDVSALVNRVNALQLTFEQASDPAAKNVVYKRGARTGALSHSAILEFALQHGDLLKRSVAAVPAAQIFRHDFVLNAADLRGFYVVCALLCPDNADVLDEFYGGFIHSRDEEGDQTRILRDRLQNLRGTMRYAMQQEWLLTRALDALLRSWNTYVLGLPAKQLTQSPKLAPPKCACGQHEFSRVLV